MVSHLDEVPEFVASRIRDALSAQGIVSATQMTANMFEQRGAVRAELETTIASVKEWATSELTEAMTVVRTELKEIENSQRAERNDAATAAHEQSVQMREALVKLGESERAILPNLEPRLNQMDAHIAELEAAVRELKVHVGDADGSGPKSGKPTMYDRFAKLELAVQVLQAARAPEAERIPVPRRASMSGSLHITQRDLTNTLFLRPSIVALSSMRQT